FFFFQAEDGIRDYKVTGVQTCALPISDVAPGYLPESFERIEAAVAPLARRGVIPLGLGGDHSITLPELRALGKVHGPLAILQFDSHTDTWDTYFAGQKHSAGTAFRRGVEE